MKLPADHVCCCQDTRMSIVAKDGTGRTVPVRYKCAAHGRRTVNRATKPRERGALLLTHRGNV